MVFEDVCLRACPDLVSADEGNRRHSRNARNAPRRDGPLQRFYRDSVPSGIVTKVDFRGWNGLGFLLWEQIQEWETDTASAALRISCHNCSRPTPVLAEKGTTRAPGYFS